MAVSWSSNDDGRADDERDLPDHPYMIAAIAVDPASPTGYAIARVPLEPVPYARPDELQNGVIDPTRVFRPWPFGDDWRNVLITHEEFE
jgi:hypothetical protein